MSQSANSAINFDLSNINMWGGGDATGFNLANVIPVSTGLFAHFKEDGLIGYKIDKSNHVQDLLAGINYSYDYGLEVTAGLILKAEATLGKLDLSYKINAVNELPTAVNSGDRFDIDTSKWTTLSQLTSLGPSLELQIGTVFTLNAYMRNLIMDFPAIEPVSLGNIFDASINFSRDFINTKEELDLSYEFPIPSDVVKIGGELPNSLAGTSGEPATANNTLPTVVAQAKQTGDLLGASVDLVELAKLVGGPIGKAIPDVSQDLYIDAGSGNWIPTEYDPDNLPSNLDSDGDGTIDTDKNIITLNYLLLDAQLKGGFKAFQEFTFKPQAVDIRMVMKVDGQVVEVQTGQLGDLFSFTAPDAGYGNIEMTPYYTLKGQIENKTGVITSVSLELSAFDFGATFENVTIGGQTFNPDVKFDLFNEGEEDKALINVTLPEGGLESDPWIWYNKTFDVNGTTLTGETLSLIYGDGLVSDFAEMVSKTGNIFDDVIKGHNSHDYLQGLAGNDTIYGYSGVDKIFAGDDQDLVYAGADDDTVEGNAGGDFLYGGKGNDALYGDARTDDSQTGNDFLLGQEGNDSLYGGSGNDYLDGGTGYDELHGGAGDDLLTSNDSDALYGESGNDTYHLGRGNYVLGDTQAVGESWGNNRYVFHAAGVNYENTRFYRDGDNLQVVFSDYSFNQLGSMTIAGYVNQRVAEGLFIYNTDGVPNNSSYLGGFNLAAVWSVISSADDIPDKSAAVAGRFSVLPSDAGSIGIGAPRPLFSDGDDIVEGTDGDDIIIALGGNDWINGKGGSDYIDAGSGNDIINVKLVYDGNFHYTAVDGGLGEDTLNLDFTGDWDRLNITVNGTVFNYASSLESIKASLEGATTYLFDGYLLDVYASSIEHLNLLTGSGYNDLLLYQAGASYDAGGGLDTFYADWSATTQGINWVNTPDVAQTINNASILNVERLLLSLGSGDDYVDNSAFNTNDELHGGAGNDTLSGGFGDDSLVGGSGNDVLNAGGGSDYIDAGSGNDIINVKLVYDGNFHYTAVDGGLGEDTLNLDFTGDWDRLNITVNGTVFNYASSLESIKASLEGATTYLFDGYLLDVYASSIEHLNLLTGSGYNDLLLYQAGASYDAGGGLDTFYADWSATTQEINWVNTPDVAQTINNASIVGVERLLLSLGSGNDLVDNSAFNSDDELHGGAGNDTLNAGGGSDYIDAGSGNDIINVKLVYDGNFHYTAVDGGLGEDTLNLDFTGDWDRLNVTVNGTNLNYASSLESIKTSLEGATTYLFDGYLLDVYAGSIEHLNLLTGSGYNDLLLYQAGASYDAGGGLDTFYADWSATTQGINWVNTPDVAQTINNASIVGVERLLLSLGSGNDLVDNSAFNSDDELHGGAGNDTINAGGGSDYIDGGSDNDSLDGGSGADTYLFNRNAGATGQDTIADTDGLSTITITATTLAQLTATQQANDLILAIQNSTDTITIKNFFDVANTADYQFSLDGGLVDKAGILKLLPVAHVVTGTTGSDVLQGGTENDTYIVNNARDFIKEPTGNSSIDTVQASVSYALLPSLENLTLTGAANLSGIGNAADNIIKGNEGNNRLLGGAGNDTLYGLSGGDTLNGGDGADTMLGGAGNDTYTVNHINDVVTELTDAGYDTVNSFISYTLTANVERLNLEGTENLNGTGNDLDNTLNGNNANNALVGGLGNDTLQGKGGADTLEGGLGNDTYYVDNVGDIVTELANEGTDKVSSSVSYTLTANVEQLFLTGIAGLQGTGNSQNNIIYGNSGNNQVFGDVGNDSLNGGAGNDLLDGGLGLDTLVGGAGNDTYILGTNSNRDLINNNDATGNDKLLFNAGINADQVWLRQLGNDLEVSIIGTANSVKVQNWYSNTANQLDSLQLADGKTLLANEVQTLVEAMAAFAAPALGQTSLTTAQHTALDSVIVASW